MPTPGKHHAKPVDRTLGAVRDTILILLPGPKTLLVALHREDLDGTVVDTVLKHGCSGINIDACRIRHANPEDFARHKAMVDRLKAQGGSRTQSWKNSSDLSGASEVSTAGRWPPNVLLVHGPGCHPECQPNCPVRLLDEAVGIRPSGSGNKNTSNRNNGQTLGNGLGAGNGDGVGGDSGSASSPPSKTSMPPRCGSKPSSVNRESQIRPERTSRPGEHQAGVSRNTRGARRVQIRGQTWTGIRVSRLIPSRTQGMTIEASLAQAITTEITSLVEDLLDNDETEAPWHLLDAIAAELGCATYAVIQEAKTQGLTVGPRGVAKRVRTISSNSHDRWQASPTHGGTGWQQVSGFAGDEG